MMEAAAKLRGSGSSNRKWWISDCGRMEWILEMEWKWNMDNGWANGAESRLKSVGIRHGVMDVTYLPHHFCILFCIFAAHFNLWSLFWNLQIYLRHFEPILHYWLDVHIILNLFQIDWIYYALLDQCSHSLSYFATLWNLKQPIQALGYLWTIHLDHVHIPWPSFIIVPIHFPM